jgi:hypothetical protein
MLGDIFSPVSSSHGLNKQNKDVSTQFRRQIGKNLPWVFCQGLGTGIVVERARGTGQRPEVVLLDLTNEMTQNYRRQGTLYLA